MVKRAALPSCLLVLLIGTLVVFGCRHDMSGSALGEFCSKLPRAAYASLQKDAASNRWFDVYQVADRVWAIYEPHQWQEVISYLIIGSEQAVLFDSGNGLGNIKAVVDQLSEKPVLVINSHSHFDHIGGNYQFERIASVSTAFSIARSRGMDDASVKQEASAEALCAPLPPGVSQKSHRIKPYTISERIAEGSIIDLGDRKLEVLQVPGHTDDAIVLLERKTGYLWTGDSYYAGPIWLFAEETDLPAYQQSIARLAALSPELTTLFPAHNTPKVDATVLVDVRNAFEKVMTGSIEPTPEWDGVIRFQFNWDYIRYFLEVVDSGSATQAAIKLGVNQSTVSRRLSQLEQQLETRLFERSTSRGWTLTNAGERMLTDAQTMLGQAQSIQRQVVSNSTELSGNIKLTISDVPHISTVLEAVNNFCEKYPAVDVEIISTNEVVDLSSRDADIAIRVMYGTPDDLIGKRIGNIKFGIYGTRELHDAYLSGQRDLPCITWEHIQDTRPDWILSNFPQAKTFKVNCPKIAHAMAVQGMGLVQTASIWGNCEPSLIRMPVGNVSPGPDLWVLSHVDLRTTLRVRLLRDELVKLYENQFSLTRDEYAEQFTPKTNKGKNPLNVVS